MRRSLLAVIFAAFAGPAVAQDAAEWSWRGTYSVIVENDKFSSFDQAKQTDRNFTNGVRFNWMSEPGLRWAVARTRGLDSGVRRLGARRARAWVSGKTCTRPRIFRAAIS